MSDRRPCRRRHPTPQPDECPACERFVNDPAFRAAWTGPRRIPQTAPGPRVPAPRLPRTPCRHLGPVVAWCPLGDRTRDRAHCELGHEEGDTGTVCRAGRCAGCPDYFPAAPGAVGGELVRHFDERSLHPELPGKRFNSSLIEYQGGYAFAFRDGWKGSEIHVARLDRRLRPAGVCRKLDLTHPDATYGREDPRFFWFRGQLHLAFIGVMPSGGRIGHTNVLYARLRDDLTVERVFHPRIEGRNKWEKNHQYFEHDGGLYAVYSFAPHRVLRIDGDRAEFVYETPTPAPWRGGEVRGGASPVRVGDEYWCWFHDRIEEGGRLYRGGLYAFDAAPPFRVQRMILEPLLVADRASKPGDQYCPVVFPCGGVLQGGRWLVSCGIHDRHSEIYAFDHAALEARLVRIAPPPGWAALKQPHDGDVFGDVVTRNEYRLPERFGLCDVILDVGGHIGIFAYACLSRGAGHVTSVEPFPDRAATMTQNMNRLYPGRHRTVAAACWGNSGGAAEFIGVPGVAVARFDDMVRELAARAASGRVRLVKLDCEGAEWPILADLEALDLVDEIVGEYHLVLPDASAGRLADCLGRAGFAVEIAPHPSGTSWEGGLFFARRPGSRQPDGGG